MELLTAGRYVISERKRRFASFRCFLIVGYRAKELCYESENTCISSCITEAALEKLSKMSDEEFEKLELYLAFDV